ncbi:hypothetical protein BX600DRAFT_504282 [Xylariales sp. PMI_506]|nr:hypothetical protein BX600DRAFT_504282 [Xylariales sp. PMI_506]
MDPSLATNPCDPSVVTNLIDEISHLGAAASYSSTKDRLDLLSEAKALVRALETPRETVTRDVWIEPATMALLAFGTEIGLWVAMAENGDDDHMLIHHCRLWSSNTSLVHLHEYLRGRGYIVPASSNDTLFHFAHNTDQSYFETIRNNLLQQERFNNWMTGYRQGRPNWFDANFYPVETRLIADFDGSLEIPCSLWMSPATLEMTKQHSMIGFLWHLADLYFKIFP